MVITTVTFEEGKPVDVKIDVKQEDGTSKREAVEAGNYVMKDETATWSEQMDTLQKFIVENDFDLSKVTLSDEEGHTDAVSGVTIKIPAYLKGVEEFNEYVDKRKKESENNNKGLNETNLERQNNTPLDINQEDNVNNDTLGKSQDLSDNKV